MLESEGDVRSASNYMLEQEIPKLDDKFANWKDAVMQAPEKLLQSKKSITFDSTMSDVWYGRPSV